MGGFLQQMAGGGGGATGGDNTGGMLQNMLMGSQGGQGGLQGMFNTPRGGQGAPPQGATTGLNAGVSSPPPPSFGQYFRSMPLPMALGQLANDPLKFITGFQDYRQEAAAQEGLNKLSDFIFNNPNLTNLDFGDPNTGRALQMEAVKAGFPAPLVSKFLDAVHIQVDKDSTNILYYDTINQTVKGLRQTADGEILRTQRYVPFNVEEARQNPGYRTYLAKTYPGLKSWIQGELGKTEKDEIAKNAFLKELIEKGTMGMIQKYKSVDVYKTVARDILGFEPDVSDPTKMLIQYSEEREKATDPNVVRILDRTIQELEELINPASQQGTDIRTATRTKRTWPSSIETIPRKGASKSWGERTESLEDIWGTQ